MPLHLTKGGNIFINHRKTEKDVDVNINNIYFRILKDLTKMAFKVSPIMTRLPVDIKLVILILPEETSPCFRNGKMMGVFLRKKREIITVR